MAVPLFLMITGRYVAAKFWENDPDEKGSSAAVLLSFLKKLQILYGISVVLYLPVGMYAGHYKQITVTGFFACWYLTELFIICGIFRQHAGHGDRVGL